MIHPKQLHSLGKLYHEEALQEAQARRLAQPVKAHRGPCSEEQGHCSRLGKLAAALRFS
jgi:hypothetical protein